MAELLYRIGRFATRRRFVVMATWLAILAITVGAFLSGGSAPAGEISIPGTPTAQVTEHLAATFPDASGGSGTVVFHTVDGAPFRDAQEAGIADSSRRRRRLDGVNMVVDPFTTQAEREAQAAQIADGRTQIAEGAGRPRRPARCSSTREGEAGRRPGRDRRQHRLSSLTARRSSTRRRRSFLPRRRRSTTAGPSSTRARRSSTPRARSSSTARRSSMPGRPRPRPARRSSTPREAARRRPGPARRGRRPDRCRPGPARRRPPGPRGPAGTARCGAGAGRGRWDARHRWGRSSMPGRPSSTPGMAQTRFEAGRARRRPPAARCVSR